MNSPRKVIPKDQKQNCNLPILAWPSSVAISNKSSGFKMTTNKRKLHEKREEKKIKIIEIMKSLSKFWRLCFDLSGLFPPETV